MISINYIQIIFAFLASSIIALGSLINSFERYLPAFFAEVCRYGKFAYKGKPSRIKPVRVPKSWFKHFYVVAIILAYTTFCIIVRAYLFGVRPPFWLKQALDVFCGELRTTNSDATSVLLAVFLFTIQCSKRFYETHFVSVFSKNSRMDLSHYVLGHIHYFGVFLAILCEAPLFTNNNDEVVISFNDLSTLKLLATLLFLWACYQQFQANLILANLRKDKNGKIITSAHKLPKGGWFDYISSPHLTTEILMYFSITLILLHNITWRFVFGWVLTNQVETALLSHWWYQETFKDFPKNRKALIPLVY